MWRYVQLCGFEDRWVVLLCRLLLLLSFFNNYFYGTIHLFLASIPIIDVAGFKHHKPQWGEGGQLELKSQIMTGINQDINSTRMKNWST